MALQYQLKEGSYHLYDMSTPASVVTGEHRLRLKTDNVAIAFNVSTGMLHEHGHDGAPPAAGRRLTGQRQ
jgi:hypothetical protein